MKRTVTITLFFVLALIFVVGCNERNVSEKKPPINRDIQYEDIQIPDDPYRYYPSEPIDPSISDVEIIGPSSGGESSREWTPPDMD